MSNAIDERLYTDDVLIELIEKHFKEYVGKMYHSEGQDFIWFASEHETIALEALRASFLGEATVIKTRLS